MPIENPVTKVGRFAVDYAHEERERERANVGSPIKRGTIVRTYVCMYMYVVPLFPPNSRMLTGVIDRRGNRDAREIYEIHG